MNKSIKEFIVRATTLLMCLVIICSNTSRIVYGQEDGDNSEKYTLTYPDGSSVSFSDYDTAKAEADKWKLLFSGKTDSDGLITLKGWASKGEIRIVEKEVPAGYTAETTETIVDLSNREVTIVNKKEEKPKLENPTPEKKEPEKPVETKVPYTVPKTGINNLFVAINPFMQEGSEELDNDKIEELDISVNVFTIKKVDQNKDPLKDVEFEVYGKAKITTEKIIKITKVRKYEEPIHPKVPEPCPSPVVPGPAQYISTRTTSSEPCRTTMSSNSLLQQSDTNAESNEETSTVTDPNINKMYIDPVITVRIEGTNDTDYEGNFTIPANKDYVEVKLATGTYRLSETVSEGINKENTYTEQSYLISYEFEINEKGEVVGKSNPQWKWLSYDNGQYTLKDNPISDINGGNVSVETDTKEISITNYAGYIEYPITITKQWKYPESCMPGFSGDGPEVDVNLPKSIRDPGGLLRESQVPEVLPDCPVEGLEIDFYYINKEVTIDIKGEKDGESITVNPDVVSSKQIMLKPGTYTIEEQVTLPKEIKPRQQTRLVSLIFVINVDGSMEVLDPPKWEEILPNRDGDDYTRRVSDDNNSFGASISFKDKEITLTNFASKSGPK